MNNLSPQLSPSFSGPNRMVSWVHFGDLHITEAAADNYRDFRALIDAANTYLTGEGAVDFAFLPGDNADQGTREQFALVRQALDELRLPVHVIPGDHDIQGGDLHLFHQTWGSNLPRAIRLRGYRLLFCNSVDIEGAKGFDFKTEQIQWLKAELEVAKLAGESVVVFMHTYPSELISGDEVSQLCRESGPVRLVEMGHTHYNELANDGSLIYAATRSTGQIEEGPAGFSVTCLDGDTVSWKFKALAEPWPFVMITHPSDEALITRAEQRVEGRFQVRARVWDRERPAQVRCQWGEGDASEMVFDGASGGWSAVLDASEMQPGSYPLRVQATSVAGMVADDTIAVRVGEWRAPARAMQDLENAIGAHLSKGILGTQLGPNKNGRKW